VPRPLQSNLRILIALRRWSVVFLLLAPAGCASIQYYSQAISGHLSLLARQQSIEELLASRQTSPDLRRKLAVVLRVRRFAARELLLPDRGSYATYVDIKRPYVTWNVFAAPEFSLTGREWCFPFAGCVRYRAYFAKSAAEAFASSLARRGDDVYLAGASAYSTLGWFADPVLSTFFEDSDLEIARLIFHELAHQKLYVQGDSEFNEAFAVAVEREGLRRWTEGAGMERQHDALLQRWDEEGRVLQYIQSARQRLSELYAAAVPIDEKRRRKASIFSELEKQLGSRGSRSASGPKDSAATWQRLDNAYLVAVGTYYAYLPAFAALLCMHGRDLGAFYRAASELGRLPSRERRLRLEELSRRTRCGASLTSKRRARSSAGAQCPLAGASDRDGGWHLGASAL
jgi:predicted aminopeptidase